MAIRLATLATVPVKRVCIAVKPVSKGDWARASAGKRINRVIRLRLGRIWRSLLLGAACNRRLGMSVAIIGTSNGLNFCRYVSEGSPCRFVCPRLLVYAAIVSIYGCLPREKQTVKVPQLPGRFLRNEQLHRQVINRTKPRHV